jgi:acetylornithine/succinyldiaminopimelate/putrescine aminotransferase
MTLKPISLSTITSQKAMSLQTQGGHTPTGVGTPLTSEQKQLALKSLKETRYPAETDIALRSMLDLVTNSKTRIDWGDDKRGSKLEISLSSESVYNRARTAVLEKLVPLPKKELLAKKRNRENILHLLDRKWGERND